MPRIRGLKPDYFKDEYLAELPFEARLLFAGLWCYADKKGRLEDRPKYIKAEIFPYDKVDIEKLLKLLADPKLPERPNKAFIRRYTVEGRQYIDIPMFLEHQAPHHTEKESKLPEFNGDLTVKLLRKKDDTVPCSLNMDRDTVKDTVKDHEGDHIEQIISYLNLICNTNYKSTTKKTIEFISARLKESFTIEDFKTVIDKKYAEWGQDSKMSAFLRPETLFGNKFESYLNQPIVKHMTKSEQAMARYLKREADNEERGSEQDCIEVGSNVS